MKRRIGVLMAVVFGLAVGIAAAQSTTVNVPFSFSVNGKSLPAGSYHIEQLGDHGTLIAGNHSSLMALGHQCEAKSVQSPKMVFHKIGDRYYLSQVWTAWDSDGLEYPASKSENGSVAANAEPAGAETVVIALR